MWGKKWKLEEIQIVTIKIILRWKQIRVVSECVFHRNNLILRVSKLNAKFKRQNLEPEHRKDTHVAMDIYAYI